MPLLENGGMYGRKSAKPLGSFPSLAQYEEDKQQTSAY